VFAVLLGWLPSFGRGDTVALGWWTTGLPHQERPEGADPAAITLSLFQMTLIIRLVRAEMLEVLRTDYIKFARARGLTDRAIHFGHALKNTLVPVITITGCSSAVSSPSPSSPKRCSSGPAWVSCSFQAINFADIPVMAAYLCLIALVFVFINLVVDLTYYAVDPRPAHRARRRALDLPSMTNPVAHISPWHADSRPCAATFTCIPSSASRSTAPPGSSASASPRSGSSIIRASARQAWSPSFAGGPTRAAAPSGLRADMDCVAHAGGERVRAQVALRRPMHGCGHDGHTTMLLAAARYLHETRNFDGTVYLIFQPGEEGYRGREGDDRGRPLRALSRGAGVRAP
jgi:hypothetical protein